MRTRIKDIDRRNASRLARNEWTDLTTTLYYSAGAALFVGGVFLAYFAAVAA